VPVVPNYSGGRDQEDHGLKLAPGKQFARPLSQGEKKNHTKKVAGREMQVVRV
jgi:hypothetical protein